MNRLAYRWYRIFSGAAYWFRRRFTRGGWLVFGGIFLAMGLAMDTEHSAAYRLFGIAICLLLSAMLWAPFFRGSFLVKRHLPRFATVDQPFAYSVEVRNGSAKTQQELLLLEDLEDYRLSYAAFKEQSPWSFRLKRGRQLRAGRRIAKCKDAALPDVPGNGAVDARVELTPLKRGSLRFEGVSVARADPLGLFRGFVRVPAPQTLLVLPKRYPLPPLALPGLTRYQHGGVALAGSIGESEEFVSLREYRRGDPLRHIHWKSSARAGELVVKEYQDEFFVRHALVLDTFGGSAQLEEFEEAASVAASFAATIETYESLLDLMFIGTQAFCFTVGRGVAHAEQMLEILATVELSPQKPFEQLHELVLRHSDGLSGCVCIFLAWDQARKDLVERLKSMGVPVSVLILVAAGSKSPEHLP